MHNEWYERMSFYQIWIRSFKDGTPGTDHGVAAGSTSSADGIEQNRKNAAGEHPSEKYSAAGSRNRDAENEARCCGDGIGDLYGVYEKLDYIKSLGVDGIWFSPIYPSPNADYGYDISDYKDIHPDYGDLNQFRRVLNKAHSLGLKVLMDLVINHTSDEHPWFQESRKGKNNPYSDYYIWRDQPNNWDSFLEGKAWTYDPVRGQYYLHLFAKKQPDLNMDNPRVREEIHDIMRFWLDMGVDGFREDVINFISKKEGLPDGLPFVPIINGLPYYKEGPHLAEYLQEMRQVCSRYDCIQIGEGPLTTVNSALKYVSGPGKVLDMMISFDHMMADCIFTEYIHVPFRLTRLKKALTKWQTALAGKAWNTLYLENHDHPRVISRYGSEQFWRESGTMLAAAYLFLQGTPFIYQGQEIGMTNIYLPKIELYKDVSSKNNYYRFHKNAPAMKRLHLIHISSRDSARTPVQWDDSENAGFTVGEPWFYVNLNYGRINAAAEEKDPASILNFYRKCLRLRRHSETLLYGDYREYDARSEELYIYARTLTAEAAGKAERMKAEYPTPEDADMRGEQPGTVYLVICSFSKEPAKVNLPGVFRGRKAHLVLNNYQTKPKTWWMRPYECRVYRYDA